MEINRKFYAVFGLALLVAIVFFIFRASKKEIIKNYPSSGTEIIAFGDSLVEGVGASHGKDFVSLLSSKIGRPIINLGVSGNTTIDGLARMEKLNKYNPKIVILLFGGNDHLQKIPIDRTFLNLEQIIENIQERGAIVLLLGVRGNLLGNKFKPEFKKLSDKYRTAFVPDVLEGLFGNQKYMADAVHPNDDGNAIIAERIYPVMVTLLR